MSGFSDKLRWEPNWNQVGFFEVLPNLLAAWKQVLRGIDTTSPAHKKRVYRPARHGQSKRDDACSAHD
eukprot:2029840-Amphidinium_carterae.2